jgi:acetylornithine deacetylase
VPDRLVAEGRFGVRLGEPVEAARAALEQRVAGFCAGHPWLAAHPARLTWTGGSFASGQLPPGSPLLGEVRAAIADTGGGVPAERAISAGSDLRLYAAAGIPTLHYGPGDLRMAHGPRERVPVADLVAVTRALALLAVRAAAPR